jgi:fructose-1-phosphate kinase PfkB-like protein
VDGQKTDQELQEYIDKTNINKKIWYVDVDVRTNVNVLYRLSKKPEYN